MFTWLKNSIAQSLAKSMVAVMLCLLATYSVPYTYQEKTPKAEAAAGGFATEVTQLLNNVELGAILSQETVTAIQNTIQTWYDNQDWLKNWALDKIAWDFAEIVRQRIVRSVINWINSGFQGAPMFVTDLQGFLLDALDEAAGKWLEGQNLGFLCSPFQLGVQVYLNVNYYKSQNQFTESSCKITDALENIQNAARGLFEGGWQSFFQVALNPQNTPAGALLSAEIGMNLDIVSQHHEEIVKFLANQGFIDHENCTSVAGGGSRCQVATPGSIIADRLKFDLKSGDLKLIEADEMNEILSALINQFVQQAFGGLSGVLGYSNPTSGEGDFFSQEEFDESQNEILSTSTSLFQIFTEAIQNELRYQRSVERVVDRIDERELAFASDPRRNRTCYTGPQVFPASLVATRESAQNASSTAAVTIDKLIILRSEYNRGVITSDEAVAAYLEMQSNGELHSEIDIMEIRERANRLIGNLNIAMEEGYQACRQEDFDDGDDNSRI